MATQNADSNADLSWLIDINVFLTPKSATGITSNTVSTSSVNNGYVGSGSPAQNDEIAWDVLLGAGTWTVELVHRTFNNKGIYHIEIDGVEEGTIDGYAGSGAYNVQDTVTGITIDESGIHELNIKMASKNASSSGYSANIHHVQLRRTA